MQVAAVQMKRKYSITATETLLLAQSQVTTPKKAVNRCAAMRERTNRLFAYVTAERFHCSSMLCLKRLLHLLRVVSCWRQSSVAAQPPDLSCRVCFRPLCAVSGVMCQV